MTWFQAGAQQACFPVGWWMYHYTWLLCLFFVDEKGSLVASVPSHLKLGKLRPRRVITKVNSNNQHTQSTLY